MLNKEVYLTFNEIKKIIERNKEEVLFISGGLSDVDIFEMEKELGVRFPIEYRMFLKEYGASSVLGITIFGVAAPPYPSVVEITKEYRRYGLPKNYVVYENCDEYVNCIDVDYDSAKYGGTISWSYVDKIAYYDSNNFFDSYLMELRESEDNL